MCGIVGAVGHADVLPLLLDGLKRLEYRGYDSAGVAVIDPAADPGARLRRIRSVGRIADLERALACGESPRGSTGIAHTRWATHGPPTEVNAHPHITGAAGAQIALVCNGIIENHEALRAAQQADGLQCASDTDTEVALNEIHRHMREGADLLAAVTAATAALEGAYALGVVSADEPGRLVGARRGLTSFITPHTQIVMAKHRRAGHKKMPIALCFGLHPAFEIMGNFSGLHMDLWGEMEMVGTIMDMDVEMVACETNDLTVPAHAEIIVEGEVNLEAVFDEEEIIAPTMYALPKKQQLPELIVTAITMRADRPIYRNHQVVPDTDHQVLPRLCHEAVLYNRLSEMGLQVHDVRFPTWGAAVSCIIQIEYPRRGFVNDALMQCMGAPWLNTKMVVAVSPDTDVSDPAEVYMAIATRADPARDMFIVPNTRCNFGDPSGTPVDDAYPHRTVGKIGIDATRKPGPGRKTADYDRAWPKNWGKVKLADYL